MTRPRSIGRGLRITQSGERDGTAGSGPFRVPGPASARSAESWRRCVSLVDFLDVRESGRRLATWRLCGQSGASCGPRSMQNALYSRNRLPKTPQREQLPSGASRAGFAWQTLQVNIRQRGRRLDFTTITRLIDLFPSR